MRRPRIGVPLLTLAAVALLASLAPDSARADAWGTDLTGNTATKSATTSGYVVPNTLAKLRTAINTANNNTTAYLKRPFTYNTTSTYNTHYIGLGEFRPSATRTETVNGYVSSQYRVKLRYFVYTPAFDGNNWLQITYTNGGANGSETWNTDSGKPSIKPPVIPTRTSTSSAGYADYYIDLPEECHTTLFRSWADITRYRNGAYQASLPGFDLRFWWYHVASLCTNSRVYIDQIQLQYLSKLDIHYSTTGAAVGGTTFTEGTARVPVAKMTMRYGSNTNVRIQTLKVTLEGTGLVKADVDALHLVIDSNNNQIYDAGDILRHTVTNAQMTTWPEITFSGTLPTSPLPFVAGAANNSSRWLICADINENACQSASPKYIGVYIENQDKVTLVSALDKVVTQADRAVATVQDTLAPATIWPLRTGSDASTWVKLIKKAKVTPAVTLLDPLTSLPTAGPISVKMGDPFKVRVVLSNEAGCGTATNAAFTLPFKQNDLYGAPDIDLLSTPSAYTIAGGASSPPQDFNFTAVLTGTLEVYGSCAFTDQSNGNNYASLDCAPSGQVWIEPIDIAILQMALFPPTFTPAISPDTSPLTLTASVKNVGTAAASNVALFHPDTDEPFRFREEGNAAGTFTYGSPVPVNLAPGEQAPLWSFTFTPTPGTEGTKSVTLYATCDENPAKVTRTSNVAQIVRPAVLSVTDFSPLPAIKTGFMGSFRLYLKVSNTGGAPVSGVTPSLPVVTASTGYSPSPLPSLRTGPSPASATIPGGGFQIFEWEFNSKCDDVQGFVDISCAGATGTDAVFGGPPLVTGAASPILSYQIDNSPSPVGKKQADVAVVVPVAYSYLGNNEARYYAINESGKLFCYDASGNEKWTQSLPALTGGPTANSSHLLNLWAETVGSDIVVFVGTSSATGRVYAFRDSGGAAPSHFWGTTLDTSYYQLAPKQDVHGVICYTDAASGTPSLAVTAGTYLHRVNLATGTKMWQGLVTYVDDLDNITNVTVKSIAAVDNNLVYVGGSDSRIRAYYWINSDDPDPVLETEFQFGAELGNTGRAGQITSPYVLGGKIYATNAKGLAVKVGDSAQLSDQSELVLAPAAQPLSEAWISLDGSTLWASRTGGPGTDRQLIHKVLLGGATMVEASGWGGGKDCTTAAGYQDFVSPPIEYEGLLYFTSYCSSNAAPTPANLRQQGFVWVASASTGLPAAGGWPYRCDTTLDYFLTPTALDPWNGLFLLGSQNHFTYLFGMP